MNRIESIYNKLGNQLVGVTKRVREELGFLRIKKGSREREYSELYVEHVCAKE